MDYFKRTIQPRLEKAFQQYPIVAILGPRQSGKTTLARHTFPDLPYVSLEDLDHRFLATTDARRFLDIYPQGAIIDEAQNAPELFSYLQGRVDSVGTPGQFILTGSQNFSMMEKITQSLAGRISLFTLLPLTVQELPSPTILDAQLFTGGYPRIYQHGIDPADFYANYVTTYLERDIRQLKNIQDLAKFERFIRLCAGRTGQLLNYTSLANEADITQETVKSWLGLLEASYLIRHLRPYHKSYNKRLVKTPKLYFTDTGLACHLLGISCQDQLTFHPLRGAIFETFVVCEILKHQLNHRNSAALYFWRDQTGHEVDCLLEKGTKLLPIEIKSSQTIRPSFADNLRYWQKLSGVSDGVLVYGGDQSVAALSTCSVIPWNRLDSLAEMI